MFHLIEWQLYTKHVVLLLPCMYICIWVPVDYPPNPLPRVQVTELCPVCSVSRDSCLCLVQGLLWWWRGVLCGYLGAGGLFFADPYIVSWLYVVSCRLFSWADLTKLHIFITLHWINQAKTLPETAACTCHRIVGSIKQKLSSSEVILVNKTGYSTREKKVRRFIFTASIVRDTKGSFRSIYLMIDYVGKGDVIM